MIKVKEGSFYDLKIEEYVINTLKSLGLGEEVIIINENGTSQYKGKVMNVPWITAERLVVKKYDENNIHYIVVR